MSAERFRSRLRAEDVARLLVQDASAASLPKAKQIHRPLTRLAEDVRQLVLTK